VAISLRLLRLPIAIGILTMTLESCLNSSPVWNRSGAKPHSFVQGTTPITISGRQSSPKAFGQVVAILQLA